MPRGISRYDEARLQGQLLTPEICAVRLRGDLRLWYNADHLTLDGSGLVEAAEDLTGQGNDGSQTTAANRLNHYPEDPMHGCRASFGSSSYTGNRNLVMGSWEWAVGDDVFMSVNYKDGIDSTFDVYSFFICGPGGYGEQRCMGTASNNTLYSGGSSWTNDVAKNGNPSVSNVILPLPTSVCRFVCDAYKSSEIHYLMGHPSRADRDLEGTCRNVVVANTSLSVDKRQLIEGVLAWDSGIGADLVADHPFVNRPPLIGD